MGLQLSWITSIFFKILNLATFYILKHAFYEHKVDFMIAQLVSMVQENKCLNLADPPLPFPAYAMSEFWLKHATP